MLIEMRARSQITLPNEIIKSLGLSEGDKFEVMERDGGVFLCPIVVYPNPSGLPLNPPISLIAFKASPCPLTDKS